MRSLIIQVLFFSGGASEPAQPFPAGFVPFRDYVHVVRNGLLTLHVHVSDAPSSILFYWFWRNLVRSMLEVATFSFLMCKLFLLTLHATTIMGVMYIGISKLAILLWVIFLRSLILMVFSFGDLSDYILTSGLESSIFSASPCQFSSLIMSFFSFASYYYAYLSTLPAFPVSHFCFTVPKYHLTYVSYMACLMSAFWLFFPRFVLLQAFVIATPPAYPSFVVFGFMSSEQAWRSRVCWSRSRPTQFQRCFVDTNCPGMI